MISKQELERLIYSMNRFQNINKGDVPAIAEVCKVLVKFLPLTNAELLVHTLENDYLATTSKDQIVIGRDLVLEIIETLKAIR